MPDRIQTALAKARARRAEIERARSDVSTGGAIATAALPAPGETDAFWAALPEISCLPKQFARSRLFAHSGGEAAAPFDQLRSRVLREMRARDWHRLGVTAPDEGSGRSTVAANLALSMARQPDLRVVLVDIDLRQPALARMLGLGQAPQLSQALRGALPLQNVLLRLGENLCLALEPAPVADTADLLQRADLPATLDRLQALLAPDVMIFDLPAMLSGDETLALLERMDCAIMVAAADSTEFPALDSCTEELSRHTAAMGVVLNKMRPGTAS